jgi:asparagine synthase (glutamine-hydrolysing)
MCGLTGFWGRQRAGTHEMRAIALSMNNTLNHRGPDAGAVWVDMDSGIALAHRRLSILDLSDAGAQPMESFSGRYIIVFNGEIYNHLDLRRDLEKKGVLFRGRSDTETILAGVEIWGLNVTLQKINGMFAFALWDRLEKKLHCARDRLGKKPFYIGWAGRSIVFGSELKSIRAHPDFTARINNAALSVYMRQSAVASPDCIYEGVWTLPPGHRISIAPHECAAGDDLSRAMEPYWSAIEVMQQSRANMRDGNDTDIITEFEELLTTCVKDRLMSDVPLGAFLSGGIDSSLIVALMKECSGTRVKTYTIGFKESGFDEAAHAKKIAQHIGTDHHELYVTAKDAMDVMPRLADMFDEPFADISCIPTYLVSKFARSGVTVALSGDGGDEMMGGYNRYMNAPKIRGYTRWMPGPARKLLAGFIKRVSVDQWNQYFPNRPQIGTLMHKAASILAMTDEDEIYNRLISSGDTDFMLRPMPAKKLPEMPQDLSFAERMMVWDAVSYLPDDILVKVDRASMAAGLECRAPLLDKRIFEYAWRLPERFKIRSGKGKWLLRQILKHHVPEELFDRPKQGFTMPVGVWLRGPLKEWANDLLQKNRLRDTGFLDANAVSKIWADHLAGRGDHAAQLWTVLMFESWRAKWM